MLARREHSEFELLRKLRAKEFAIADIEVLLLELSQKGFLSNTRFMESYVRARRRKGYGPLRIRAELIERGLQEDFIEHHLNITDNAWLIDARTAWQKRFKNQLPRDFKARAQQMRFLQYRGFTHEHIKSLLNSDDET